MSVIRQAIGGEKGKETGKTDEGKQNAENKTSNKRNMHENIKSREKKFELCGFREFNEKLG